MLKLIYKELKSLQVCKSAYHFSYAFLGKAKSYYSVLLATGIQPSIGAISMLEISMLVEAQNHNGTVKDRLLELSNELGQLRILKCKERFAIINEE